MVSRLNKASVQANYEANTAKRVELNKPAAAAPAKPATKPEPEKVKVVYEAPVDDSYPHAGQPVPQSIGLCADLYSEVRSLRLSMDKVVKQVADRENEIREHIISNLSKSDDTGAAGKKYRAQIVMKDVPKLEDWTALCKYIAKNDRFDLVQKRLGEKAALDMLEAGEAIPGVSKMKIPTVSITKI